MASGFTTEGPICLVENQNNQLTVNPKALEILDKISQPVVVVAIAGLYRTGKSYLMNHLAGKKRGFPLGSTVKSETKGIWMCCVPKPNHTLVLLDTEGLGNVEKGDSQNDSWIFALAVLLSSMLVYNSLGTINHQALEQLHYVTELKEVIREKFPPSSGGVEDSAEFTSSTSVKKGMPIGMEDGRSPQIEKSNLPRECIRRFFPRRKCFVFDRPTNDKHLLQHLDKARKRKLDKNFQNQSKNFCKYIFTQANTKTQTEETTVTGKGLGILARTYVDAINSGAVSCLENGVTTLAQIENAAAVQKAADHYSQQMAQRVRFPTDTLQELLDVHRACERDAIQVFGEHSFKNDEREFREKLLDTIEKKKNDFLRQNEKSSAQCCQAQIEQFAEPLMEGISGGSFSKPRGYQLFRGEMDKIVRSYNQVPRKGVKAHEVLQNFLQSQEATKESILQADEALTAGEKALAAEHEKLLEAEKENKLLRQKEKEQEEKLEAQEKSFKEHLTQLKEKIEKERDTILRKQEKMLEHRFNEHIAQLKEKIEKERDTILRKQEEMLEHRFNEQIAQLKKKMEEERDTILREQEEMMAHKLKEQEELLKEEFKEKSNEMNEEIRHLRERIEEINST